jgi:hypothetical protein
VAGSLERWSGGMGRRAALGRPFVSAAGAGEGVEPWRVEGAVMLRADGVGGRVATADGLLSRGREAQHPYGSVLADVVMGAATWS